MNVVVIGAQWGDEGKGKMVDYLAQNAQAVVRYAGGANAGHTIVIGDQQYALHQVPSGILYPGKTVYLGSGMVIDPQALFEELQKIDKERDAARKRPIGTTGRGIGITYSMKSERDGIRLADLDWAEKMQDLEKEDLDFLEQYKEKLISMRVNISSEMWKYRNKNVLMEGAQGAMLDLDLGTYPYVSSGLSCSAGASVGSGIGPRKLDKILGVFKAYTTRVGNGPMPSEFDENSQSELYKFVRDTGREYGVTTGRPRRCGYLDLVALRYACRTNSIDDLLLTHLDVYDSLNEIEACVGYEIDGKIVTEFPASIEDLNKAKPILEKFPGWKKSLKECKTFKKLPKEAKNYIKYIESYTGTKIGIVSVGYERNETFILRNPWKK